MGTSPGQRRGWEREMGVPSITHTPAEQRSLLSVPPAGEGRGLSGLPLRLQAASMLVGFYHRTRLLRCVSPSTPAIPCDGKPCSPHKWEKRGPSCWVEGPREGEHHKKVKSSCERRQHIEIALQRGYIWSFLFWTFFQRQERDQLLEQLNCGQGNSLI